MKRTTFWKSDLWRYCVGFGLVGLLFAVDVVIQAMHGQSGEAAGNAFVAVFLLAISLIVGITDRSPAAKHDTRIGTGDLSNAHALAWQDSCLNPGTEINRSRTQDPPTLG